MTQQAPSTAKTSKKAVINRELEALYEKHGRLDAHIVLNAARPLKSPLHSYFEWNDSVAAEKYRLDQAYRMILASKFTVLLQDKKPGLPELSSQQTAVRQFVPQLGGGGFVFRKKALSDEDNRAAYVEQKRRELLAWCNSVADLDEFSKICAYLLKNI